MVELGSVYNIYLHVSILFNSVLGSRTSARASNRVYVSERTHSHTHADGRCAEK